VRVFRVEADVNTYQYFMLQDQRLLRSEQLRFDGTVIHEWSPPAVFSYQPQLAYGDFWGFQMWSAALAASPKAIRLLHVLFARAGQLLDLPYQGEHFGLLNVTQCVDCLDPEHTQWILGQETKKPIRIAKYSFVPERLPESSIFKLPQTARSEILCHEGRMSNEDEFRACVEAFALHGLHFRQIWTENI